LRRSSRQILEGRGGYACTNERCGACSALGLAAGHRNHRFAGFQKQAAKSLCDPPGAGNSDQALFIL
jgi:hypothetical protein